MVSLDTDSRSVALHRAHSFNLTLEAFWTSLSLGNADNAEIKFAKAVQLAKACGFRYLSKEKIVNESSLSDFVNRINIADAIDNNEIKEAMIGALEKPIVSLKQAKEKYFTFEIGNHKGKSEYQIKKWQNPRNKAVRNFLSVVGDKSINKITRDDILSFREWWVKKIQKKGMAENSANKEFGFINRIIRHANDTYLLGIPVDSLFRGIRLKEIEKVTRHPFSNSFICETLLNPYKIGLNIEARMLIYAMVDTGARISELTGLDDENGDIILAAEIPYIRIRPNRIRNLKTTQSERDIPLVGASLLAFQTLEGSFKKYLGKADLISSTINKYFRDNDILPSDNHSLYSLRHSFEDRLTAVEPPDKLQAALMGHKYSRPRYGLGPSLEQKRSWLDKIAFTM